MKHFTPVLAAFLVAAGVSAAAAQTQVPAGSVAPPPAGPSAYPAVPRVELGGSLGVGIGLVLGESGGAAILLPGARISTALNPRWALEGVFDVMGDDSSLAVMYRVQARWRFRREAADAGRPQPHLTFGGTGWVEHQSWGPYEWRDQNGAVRTTPRQTRWDVTAPMRPTVGVGVQKTLGARMALRADLAAILVPADEFVFVLLMPSVSVSIPIGKYPTAARR